MPDNRQIQSNAVSISPNAPTVDNIEEGMWRMKIEKKEGVGGESSQFPDRPGEPDCIYYLRTGLCGYGTNCRFNHPPLAPKTTQNRIELPQRDGQPDCGYYLKTGICKYGSTCKYHHPLDRRGAGQVPLNTLGLPMRQEEKPCPYYMRTYTCKFGPACKFHHPQPTSVETALAVSGSAANFGAMGPALPSNGIPYVGALQAWSVTRSPYIASPRVPGSQSYVPFVYPPPLQASVPPQSWNGYMGGSNTLPAASNVMGTNLVYNSKNHGDLLSNGQVDLLAMTIPPPLPERPDQPECRYFMSTGYCKYGSNCKFHHPKERIAMSNLGPHGLPLRPGEDICAHFSSYGICKYGPNCKFNHPFAGYYSSFYLGMPSIPTMLGNQPFFPNQRNSTAISNSSETSQSKSSKITDWIQKPETVEVKNSNNQHNNSEAKAVKEDSHDLKATPTTSELAQDQTV